MQIEQILGHLSRKLKQQYTELEKAAMDINTIDYNHEAYKEELSGIETTLSKIAAAKDMYWQYKSVIDVHKTVTPMPGHSVTLGTAMVFVLEHILQGKKINAIKEYRVLTGSSLKEAKEQVDKVMDMMVEQEKKKKYNDKIEAEAS